MYRDGTSRKSQVPFFMKKIIGLTYDLKSDWVPSSDDPVDANAEWDKPRTIERIQEALEKGGYATKRIGNVQNLLDQIDELDVDIVLNICEGYKGRNRESQVPLLLEMKGIPFVGSDALTLGITLDKVMAKKIFMADGIPTPRFFVADSLENLEQLENKHKLTYPLIVKTRHEGTSKGLTENSRVRDFKSLKREVEIVLTRYHQTALVEEFIRGTECTVPVLGNKNPQAMPVAQICIDGKLELADKFFTFDMVAYDGLKYVCPSKFSPLLIKKLQDLALKAYRAVECLDFGRVDFRIDEKGNPYVLEINPLPSLAEADVFNIFPVLIGSNYDETINKILEFALERYGMLGQSANLALRK